MPGDINACGIDASRLAHHTGNLERVGADIAFDCDVTCKIKAFTLDIPMDHNAPIAAQMAHMQIAGANDTPGRTRKYFTMAILGPQQAIGGKLAETHMRFQTMRAV